MAEAKACYVEEVFNPNEIWKTGSILTKYAPLLFLQIAFNIFICNIFHYILRPLHQPRLIAEVLAGMCLGLFSATDNIMVRLLLPSEGVINLETYAAMGIMCYCFLSGLEMNLDDILKIQKKKAGSISIAISGIIIPMLMGLGFYALIEKLYQEPSILIFRADNQFKAKAYLFWSLALTITSFPVLARILADLKLLYTGLGKATLTTAMISDTYGWLLLIILIPFANNDVQAFWSVLGTIMFIAFCIFVLRPVMTKYIEGSKNEEEDTWDNSLLLVVLMGTFACSFVTDVLGTHSIVGAFVYGLVLPHGRFADFVMRKLDDFVSVAMSPVFFFRSGLTVNFFMLAQQKYWPCMVLIMFLLSIPKVVSTLIATFFFGVPIRDGVGIGLLLNSKGVLAIIILNTAWDRKILSVVAFSIMVCAVLMMTILVPLLVNAIYKPRKRYENVRLRTIEKLRMDSEVRVISYVLNIRQATSMVNVLRAFNATRISPLHVFGVHLVELIGRATALFASQIKRNPANNSELQNLSHSQLLSENISTIFKTLAEACAAVRVQTLDVVSNYETIHRDIQDLAEQKRTALILMPFHKELDVNGDLETSNDDEVCRNINQNVLQDAPCSVAIFVDRGLGSLSRINLHIMMIFIGGPDDREALAIAWRMARHPGNKLSTIRILLSGEAAAKAETSNHDEIQWLSSAAEDEESQKLLDEECIESFRFKGVYNNDSITYSEEEVHNSEEFMSLLHELDKDDCDLYIIGRGRGGNSVMFLNFMEWCDNPELGVIGDIVTSKSFGSRSSLLSVQQFGSRVMMFGDRDVPTKTDGGGSEPFVNTL
ncbi:cation/H(+) antiporter 15-like [Neltuma alba]|uniref:cation/H(+) antiporter 15-like n=1 Tax=Neltuma alba TaxID=207710 RepID=UPI0010A5911D|nr:cation/H(+) antiporter 15-like [Prosopis alba]